MLEEVNTFFHFDSKGVPSNLHVLLKGIQKALVYIVKLWKNNEIFLPPQKALYYSNTLMIY